MFESPDPETSQIPCQESPVSRSGGGPPGTRAVRVGAEDFHCPTFVHRVGHGWQLRFKRVPSMYFADATHGGPGPSLRAAAAARAQQLPDVEAMRRAVSEAPRDRSLGVHEQARKLLKTGVVGVYLLVRHDRRGRTISYSLSISCPGQKSRSLYVGTDSTLRARLPAKLEEARALREQWVEQLAASKAMRRDG